MYHNNYDEGDSPGIRYSENGDEPEEGHEDSER